MVQGGILSKSDDLIYFKPYFKAAVSRATVVKSQVLLVVPTAHARCVRALIVIEVAPIA